MAERSLRVLDFFGGDMQGGLGKKIEVLHVVGFGFRIEGLSLDPKPNPKP